MIDDEVDVIVKVSGRQFELKMNTLSRIPYLYNMINDCSDISSPKPIKINVWRSPMLFEHVLALVYDPEYNCPLEGRREADFYLVEYDDKKRSNIEQHFSAIEKSHQHILMATNDIRLDTRTIGCIKTGCTNVALDGSLHCYVHEKKCIFRECKVDALYYNTCAEHREFGRVRRYCKKRSCRGYRIAGTDLCSMHLRATGPNLESPK